MKQYFTGFFTAVCLTTSVFLFIGADDNVFKENIIFKSDNGYTVINEHGVNHTNLDGNVVWSLGSNEKGGIFYLADQSGEVKVGANIDAYGAGAFNAFSPSGNIAAMMYGSDTGGQLSIYTNKKTEFQGRISLSVTNNDDGEITLWNNKNNITAIIGALHNDKHKGDGFINLNDRYGDYGWGKAGKN